MSFRAERSGVEESFTNDGARLRMMPQYYVYILSSFTRTLYVGVTNNLHRRVNEHQQKLVPGFTSQYNIDRLVYYEVFNSVRDAIAREKQLKNWARAKKERLIEAVNPAWEDLS